VWSFTTVTNVKFKSQLCTINSSALERREVSGASLDIHPLCVLVHANDAHVVSIVVYFGPIFNGDLDEAIYAPTRAPRVLNDPVSSLSVRIWIFIHALIHELEVLDRIDRLHPAASAVFPSSSVGLQGLDISTSVIALLGFSFFSTGSSADLLLIWTNIAIAITITIAVAVAIVTIVTVAIVTIVTVAIVTICDGITLVAGVVDADKDDTVVNLFACASQIYSGCRIKHT